MGPNVKGIGLLILLTTRFLLSTTPDPSGVNSHEIAAVHPDVPPRDEGTSRDFAQHN